MNEEQVHKYYSNGKLLITGEYLVLHGALSFAVPTKAGQALYIYRHDENELLDWKAGYLSNPWFKCLLDPESMAVIHTNNTEIAGKLVRILSAASEIKGDSDWLKGVSATSEIGFDIGWGLGSSSTMISNLAWWADIDPFRLSGLVSEGSGYDIACARNDLPIHYRNTPGGPEFSDAQFDPPFADNLGFVYLGKKQDSAESVKNFLNYALVTETHIQQISEISTQLPRAGNLADYENLLVEHETILSGILDRPPVKEVLFRDYPGMVKSLGAWGGDFVHISYQDPDSARKYFSGKGLDVLVPWSEMVKT
jgi:mevalonate kinase